MATESATVSGVRGRGAFRAAGSRGGFTILEVMIALVVVTIGAVAALALQASAARSQGQTMQRYEAMHLAESILYRIQSDASVWRPAPATPPDSMLVGITALSSDDWRYAPVLDDDDPPAPINSRGIRTPEASPDPADLANRGGRLFCPEYRLVNVTGGSVDAPIRAVTVRVYFPRQQEATALFADCSDDTRDLLRELGELAPGAARVVTPEGEFGFGVIGMVQVNGVIRAQRPVQVEDEV